MATPPEVLRVILDHRIQDADQAFELGHRLYRFELMIGSIGIGLTTLVCMSMAVWITSLGESRATGIVALLAIAAVGLLALVWLWMRVRRWSDELLATTNADLEAAYAAYTASMNSA